MKQYILFCFVCVLAIVTAGNLTNKTSPVNNDLSGNNDDESFYTIDVLLVADGVSTPNNGQNDTGLSIRLTAHDGTISAWHRLYINDESNYFGQRNYILSENSRYLGVISSISIRIDKPELAALSMPYYICIHGTTNNGTINFNWNGCSYIQSIIGNKNENDQQYPLRDANGKLL